MKSIYTVHSDVTGVDYDPQKSCRILDVNQAALYLKHGVYPLDIYYSPDRSTGKPRIVFIFDKTESYPLFDLYLKHELT